jgi:hypothetical protein
VVFQNIYTTVKQLCAEPLMLFCGTLVGKHCAVWQEKSVKFTILEIASVPWDIWNSNALTWLLLIAACWHETQLTSPVPAELLLYGTELCACRIVPSFEVLLVVKIMITVLWNVAPYSQEDSYQHFRGTCCISNVDLQLSTRLYGLTHQKTKSLTITHF